MVVAPGWLTARSGSGIYVMYEGDFSPNHIILNMLMSEPISNAVNVVDES